VNVLEKGFITTVDIVYFRYLFVQQNVANDGQEELGVLFFHGNFMNHHGSSVRSGGRINGCFLYFFKNGLNDFVFAKQKVFR
jgi:hypothetical protein